ncbi:MAG: hypothetical protein HOJ34_02885 [Kordiimonadaceae bacterium]|jgi:hypothetical protein|nr:hypothetical protein [Kordiimonadaceae bacterium]MBT6036623.1 hypothetical protein [Kordiimonadaceae bacterium]MBT6328705.1 hypothetical protein [Kordiimonadaceae bacterium]MBT7583448.1 hypothetical protein [Kordiimonadaceae bacterium]
MRILLVLCAFLLTSCGYNIVSDFQKITKDSHWQLVEKVETDFETFHTQGMLKIGNYFYVSAVEVIEPTETYGKTDALDDFSLTRTTGQGRGWIFKFDQTGSLVQKTELTRGSLYHPGGMDFDGQYIWVPVAEYRPNSKSDIYRIDPDSMAATLSFSLEDHVGDILRNPKTGKFHGASWGARRLYQWDVELSDGGTGKITTEKWSTNPVKYIDYQDCHLIVDSKMICGGVGSKETSSGDVAIGGLDLIDISGEKPTALYKLQVEEYIDDEMVITNNPFWIEQKGMTNKEGDKVMQFYFMPDNHKKADLLIYQVVLP